MSVKIPVRWMPASGAPVDLSVPSGGDLALLDLCENEGVDLPYGCRSGSCGSCRVVVLEGAEMLSERSFLENDTLERYKDAPEIRLACRAQINFQNSAPARGLVIKKAPEVVFED